MAYYNLVAQCEMGPAVDIEVRMLHHKTEYVNDYHESSDADPRTT